MSVIASVSRLTSRCHAIFFYCLPVRERTFAANSNSEFWKSGQDKKAAARNWEGFRAAEENAAADLREEGRHQRRRLQNNGIAARVPGAALGTPRRATWRLLGKFEADGMGEGFGRSLFETAETRAVPTSELPPRP